MDFGLMEVLVLSGMFILAIIGGVAKAVMDTISFHYDSSVFKNKKNQLFWDSSKSWKNKYKEDLETPKFFLSTTMFVFMTDAWHLYQNFFLNSIRISILISLLISMNFITALLVIISYSTIFAGAFEYSFRKFEIK
jgi:hypothetical protein